MYTQHIYEIFNVAYTHPVITLFVSLYIIVNTSSKGLDKTDYIFSVHCCILFHVPWRNKTFLLYSVWYTDFEILFYFWYRVIDKFFSILIFIKSSKLLGAKELNVFKFIVYFIEHPVSLFFSMEDDDNDGTSIHRPLEMFQLYSSLSEITRIVRKFSFQL